MLASCQVYHAELGHTYGQIGVAVGDLDRSQLVLIENIPVVHGSVCDEAQRVLADPLPEDDILVHGCRLQLLLVVQVEDLDCPLLGLEGDDVEVPVHDSTIGLDRPSGDIIVVLQVDDDDLGRCGLVLLLADADVVIGLESLNYRKQSISTLLWRVLGRSEGKRQDRAGLTQELKPIALVSTPVLVS